MSFSSIYSWFYQDIYHNVVEPLPKASCLLRWYNFCPLKSMYMLYYSCVAFIFNVCFIKSRTLTLATEVFIIVVISWLFLFKIKNRFFLYPTYPKHSFLSLHFSQLFSNLLPSPPNPPLFHFPLKNSRLPIGKNQTRHNKTQ